MDFQSMSAGARSVKLVSPGSGVGQELIYTWKGYKPGAGYSLGFDAKTSGAAGGRVQIIDTATNAVLADATVSGAAWMAYTASFTTPAAYDHTLKIVLRPDNASVTGTVWFDELDVDSN
jgi:hypothetical protein